MTARHARAATAAGPDFSAATLTQANGYSGIDGIFRLTAEGGIQRGLAVLEVRRDGPVVIDWCNASIHFDL